MSWKLRRVVTMFISCTHLSAHGGIIKSNGSNWSFTSPCLSLITIEISNRNQLDHECQQFSTIFTLWIKGVFDMFVQTSLTSSDVPVLAVWTFTWYFSEFVSGSRKSKSFSVPTDLIATCSSLSPPCALRQKTPTWWWRGSTTFSQVRNSAPLQVWTAAERTVARVIQPKLVRVKVKMILVNIPMWQDSK